MSVSRRQAEIKSKCYTAIRAGVIENRDLRMIWRQSMAPTCRGKFSGCSNPLNPKLPKYISICAAMAISPSLSCGKLSQSFAQILWQGKQASDLSLCSQFAISVCGKKPSLPLSHQKYSTKLNKM